MLWNSTYGGPEIDKYFDLVECTNGDFVTVGCTTSFGAGHYDGWLVKTRYPLVWDPAPTDQTLAYGVPLAYDLNASAWFGIDTWIINDTTQFAINSNGVVSDVAALPIGGCGLRVSVNDTMGNEIWGVFSITVEAPLISPVPLLLIVVAVIVIIVVVLLLLYYFKRKRKP